MFVCDIVKKSKTTETEWRTIKNGNGVTRNEPDYRLNPPDAFSPLQTSSSLGVAVCGNLAFKNVCHLPRSLRLAVLSVCVCGRALMGGGVGVGFVCGGGGVFKK